SERNFLPVRSLTRRRKARSVGAKAVARTLPSASTPTAELGLAATTARAASVTMSKSPAFLSKWLPSEVSTETSERSFGFAASAAVAGATLNRVAAVARAAREPTRRFMGLLLEHWTPLWRPVALLSGVRPCLDAPEKKNFQVFLEGGAGEALVGLDVLRPGELEDVVRQGRGDGGGALVPARRGAGEPVAHVLLVVRRLGAARHPCISRPEA